MLDFRNIAVWLTAYLATVIAIASPQSVNLHFRVINNFPVKYISVNMHDPEVVVTTAVSQPFPYGLESWGSFLRRLNPDAAINGTYFSVSNYRPVGDVACNGALLYRGCVGTALCIAPNNHATMQTGSGNREVDWTGYRTVLGAGPRLLTDGKVTLYPRDEGFRDPHVLGSAPRSAMALCKDGMLLLISIQRSISLRNLAWVCQKLGAEQAMALDGGSSSALYAGGRTVTWPGRHLSTVIAVYATPVRYQAVADQLMPVNTAILARLLPPTAPASATTVILPTSPPSAASSLALTPLVQFIEPDPGKPASGIIPVTIKYADDNRIAICSLRINGQLRAMSNTRSLAFSWDSTKESNGTYTLEAAVWTSDNKLIATESRKITVQNSSQVAGN